MFMGVQTRTGSARARARARAADMPQQHTPSRDHGSAGAVARRERERAGCDAGECCQRAMCPGFWRPRTCFSCFVCCFLFLRARQISVARAESVALHRHRRSRLGPPSNGHHAASTCAPTVDIARVLLGTAPPASATLTATARGGEEASMEEGPVVPKGPKHAVPKRQYLRRGQGKQACVSRW